MQKKHVFVAALFVIAFVFSGLAQLYVDAVPGIRAALDEGEKAFVESRLSDSRAKLVTARNLINETRQDIPPKDGIALALRCAKLIYALDIREDSLVHEAIEILEDQGHEAASVFLREVMRKGYSISNERAVFVDQVIMNSMPTSALEQEVSEKNKAANIYAPKIELTEKDFEKFESMQNRARFRVLDRSDSVRAANDAGMKVYAMLEAGKINDAQEEFGRQEEFLSAAMAPSAFEMLGMSVAQAVSMPVLTERDMKRLAKEEERRTKEESKRAARQAKIDKANAEKQAKADKKEQARLAKNKGKAPAVATAHAAAGGAQSPPAGAPIAGAPIAGAGAGDPNLQMAQNISARIYALVERGNITEAHDRFLQYKRPLQKYMSPDEYQALEYTVLQSYHQYVTQR